MCALTPLLFVYVILYFYIFSHELLVCIFSNDRVPRQAAARLSLVWEQLQTEGESDSTPALRMRQGAELSMPALSIQGETERQS